MTVTVTHTTEATLPNDPTKEVSSDAWNEGHTVTGLATVAETGDYNDLLNKPAAGGLTLDDVIDALYPVGSLYTSSLSTNPGTLLGRGTWSAFGAGRVMVGHNAGDTDFDTGEETGGAKTVAAAGNVSAPTFTGDALATHSHGVGTYAPSAHAGTAVSAHAGTAVADHASHTHTYTEVPNHTHPHNMQGGTTGSTTGTNVMGSTATGGNARAMAIATSNNTSGVATGTTNGPGAALTHSVTQPSNHTVTQPDAHTMSGSSQAVAAGTPAGSVSAPTFTGTATSVVQPYIVVYAWKRTA